MDVAEQLSQVQICLQNAGIIRLIWRLWLQRAKVIECLTAMATYARKSNWASRPEGPSDPSRELTI